MREQVGGRLDQVATRREIADLDRVLGVLRQIFAEGQQRLTFVYAVCLEPQRRARSVVGWKLSGREWGAIFFAAARIVEYNSSMISAVVREEPAANVQPSRVSADPIW